MVIIQVMGGLGNQLQQYALYQKFIQLGVNTKLDVSWFASPAEGAEKPRKTGEQGPTGRKLELDYFDGLSYEACTPREKAKLIGTNGICGKIRRKIMPAGVHWFHESDMYHPEILRFKDMYLSGYFACEKYYADILKDLRESIQFPKSGNPENERLAQEMQTCESVSIHIRRGDYLDPENAAMFGNICTDAYYESAVKDLKESCRNAHFYVFSDDVPYVRQKFAGKEYTVVDINHGEDSFFDMWLMSNCKHNICANSTFSFWGARLNKNEAKIMIRPTIHKNTQVFRKEEMEDLWKGWQFISPLGKVE